MNVKPSDNAYAKFQCRKCGIIWYAHQIFLDDRSTAVRWRCGDARCGGTVDEVREVKADAKAE